MRGRRSIDNENMVEWATAKHDKRDTQCEGSIPVQKWRQVRHNIKMWTFKTESNGLLESSTYRNRQGHV